MENYINFRLQRSAELWADWIEQVKDVPVTDIRIDPFYDTLNRKWWRVTWRET
jgi:hypothetical protein